jgi:hypothetical protein
VAQKLSFSFLLFIKFLRFFGPPFPTKLNPDPNIGVNLQLGLLNAQLFAYLTKRYFCDSCGERVEVVGPVINSLGFHLSLTSDWDGASNLDAASELAAAFSKAIFLSFPFTVASACCLSLASKLASDSMLASAASIMASVSVLKADFSVVALVNNLATVFWCLLPFK